MAIAIIAGVAAFVARTAGADHDGHARAGDFGHVHGLAVDPGTGKLLAATHAGLYRVDGRRTAVRVSEGTPDLMGFTVVEPGRYLASGHPGEHDAGPSNLGLLESTDGGRTWEQLSLSGSADFHGLRAAHGTVYGHNSADGAFLVSTDRKTWQRRSTAPIGGFVVSPTDPAVIVAVGRDRLLGSGDTGGTWQAIPGSPRLSVLAWDAGSQLFGADAAGTVWQSTDGGQQWQRRGNLPGAPQAIAAAGGTVYAAIAGDRFLASDDAGVTWTERYRPA